MWGDATSWKTFRRLCHAYLLAWLPDHYRDFVIGSLPLQLIVGVGDESRIEPINTVEEYRQFLVTEDSLLAWADPNWEMQNVCNVFRIDLNIFVYGRSGPLESRQYMMSMQPNPDVIHLSNDKIPAKHTIYLYYQDQTHYETIIARPHNFAIQDDVRLSRQRSKSDGGVHARPAQNVRSSSVPREDLVFRTGIQSKGRPRKTARMGCPAQPGQRKGKDYVDSQATMTDVDGLNSPRTKPKKRRGRPPGSRNKPKVPGDGVKAPNPKGRKQCAPLQEISDFLNNINKPGPTRKPSVSYMSDSDHSSTGSMITRSRSKCSAEVSNRTLSIPNCPTCTLPLDQYKNNRMCEDCLNGCLKCRTCLQELDGLDPEVLCPKCQRKLHVDCLKGESLFSN